LVGFLSVLLNLLVSFGYAPMNLLWTLLVLPWLCSYCFVEFVGAIWLCSSESVVDFVGAIWLCSYESVVDFVGAALVMLL
jgi:hypothetical protein